MSNLKTAELAQQTRCCGPDGCGRLVEGDLAMREPKRWPHGPGRYCIGTGCQAWRFIAVVVTGSQGTQTMLSKEGYCGLAGIPE